MTIPANLNGDCWNGCQDCKSCVNCWCSCTSECCIDSQCGHPDCWNCVNCHCELQCNEGQICCDDGSCAKPCELEEIEGKCEGAVVSCTMECGVNCFDYTRISYTGNKVYRCKEEGCPGDCQDAEEEVVCSIEMLCDIYIIGGPTCLLGRCVGLPPPLPPSACPACMAGFTPEPVPPESEPKEITVPSKICN